MEEAKLEKLYYLLTNSKSGIHFSVVHATVVSSAIVTSVWTINFYDFDLVICVKEHEILLVIMIYGP